MQLACLDGKIIPLAQATVPATDDGLLRGDGVFEVMRLYGGIPFALATHLERLGQSARNLRLEVDVAALAGDVQSLLAAAQPRDGLLRALATRGGRRIVLIEELPAVPARMRLGYVTYAPVRILDGIKSLSYAANMLASRLARERGFDEALLMTPHGRVLELPTASFFWVAAGRIYTPPLADHILDSITRALVMEVAEVQEQSTAADDLELADEAFIASSVTEVLSVGRIEERDLASGPVTETVARAVRERIASELARG